jgi:hypothetical protein
MERMDAEAQARAERPLEDKSIDVDFRSGVYLGVGMSHIVIGLMPTRLATVPVELFGYKGNRHLGLSLLQKAGGWTKESPELAVSQGAPLDFTITVKAVIDRGTVSGLVGVRRSICDMWLLIDLIFHLFLSSFTHDGVDVMIVDWNLKCCLEGKLIAWQTTRPLATYVVCYEQGGANY